MILLFRGGADPEADTDRLIAKEGVNSSVSFFLNTWPLFHGVVLGRRDCNLRRNAFHVLHLWIMVLLLLVCCSPEQKHPL